MTIDKFIANLKNSKLRIPCVDCGREWLVGDRERNGEERAIWLCPQCRDKAQAEEAMIDELNSQREAEEPIDFTEENKMIEIMSPKDAPNFYQE
jgi:ribosomal protein L37AE/L43A